jgi:hypothetical protein
MCSLADVIILLPSLRPEQIKSLQRLIRWTLFRRDTFNQFHMFHLKPVDWPLLMFQW